MPSDPETAIQQHYERVGLTSRVLSAIRDAGLSLERLKPADLAAVDAFHIRGREATQELATLAGLREGDKVLDLGSGLGGTARYLAETLALRGLCRFS